MTKREDALEILKSLGLPKQQQNERSCLTLLALAGLKENGQWKNVDRPLLRVWDVMDWMRDHYRKDYAANSRETIRRHTIHQFEQARLIDRNPDDPTRPTNSGATVYQLTPEAAAVLKRFGKREFSKKCEAFIERFGSLSEAYQRSRDVVKVPVTLPDGAQAHTACAAFGLERFAYAIMARHGVSSALDALATCESKLFESLPTVNPTKANQAKE